MRWRRHLVCVVAALVAMAGALVVSQPQPVAAATGGTITIVLNANPADGTDFGFGSCQGSGCGHFALDKDADAALPSTITGTGLAAGTYTITQDAVPGWTLTSLTCTTGGTVSVANRQATIALTDGRTVTCTFTDQSPSITIVQDTSPDDGADVSYNSCLGAGCGTFALDDDGGADATLPNTLTGGGLAPGTYTITQALNPTWGLTGIACSTTSGITKDIGLRRATIVLSGPTDHHTCTFTNKTQSIRVIEDDLADAGDDYTFTSCQNTTGCGTFTLDDDGATDATNPNQVSGTQLPMGTYTITQDPLDGHELVNLVCTGLSGDLATGRVSFFLRAGENRTCTFSNRPVPAALAGVAELTNGFAHTCARLTDGEARCWGDKVLGDGVYDASSVPRVVVNPEGTGPLTGVVDIDAGDYHTCAALEDTTAVCWGTNAVGELGNGTTNPTGPETRPVVVLDPEGTAPLTGVTSVNAGRYRSCATLEDGQARCWGDGTSGALGNQQLTASTLPVVVSDGDNPLTDVARIVTAASHTCAILATEQARCWGDAAYLGDGTGHTSLTPVSPLSPDGTGPLTGVTDIATTWQHTCAALSDGHAVCWGVLPTSQTIALRPVLVPNEDGTGPEEDVVEVATGAQHSCLSTSGGEAHCWGSPLSGQLGHGPGDNGIVARPRPVLLPPGDAALAGVAHISAGSADSCAVLVGGEARCWGRGGYVGDGTTVDRFWAATVVAP